MIENPYSVGDTVLASRSDDGESYEEAKVVDAYSLIIGADERPMVAVEFPDGQRVYLTANGPDVQPVENQQGEEDADG